MKQLIKRDPFYSLFSFPRLMDDFDDMGSQRGLKLRETDSAIIAEAVVAGVAAKDVEVNIEDGVLTIKAEAHEEEEKKGEYKAASYQYYYTAALSGGQWDKADAIVKNGVVTVKIPKAVSVKPRKITVREHKE